MNKKLWGLVVLFSIVLFTFLSLQTKQVYAEKLVPKDKDWTITFNTVINPMSISEETIYVKDEEGNKVDEIELDMDKVFNTDGSVNFTKWYSTVEVENKENYKAGEYTLVITDSVRNLFFQKLKEKVSFDFTVEADNEEQNTDESEEYDTSIYENDSVTHLSTNRFDYKDGKFYFKENGIYSDLLPGTELHPNIHSKIDTIVRSMYNEDNETHVYVSYGKKLGNSLPSFVGISMNQAAAYGASGNYKYKYYFYDKEPYKGKYKTRLKINKLSDGPDTYIEGEYASEKYKEELKNSVQALYPKEAESIFNFIYNSYNERWDKKLFDSGKSVEKEFNNVIVKYVYDGDNVYFIKK